MACLDVLENLMAKNSTDVNAWFTNQWHHVTPPLYYSCDIRHARFKIGIVDTNLFPAGFNNLCPAFSRETTAAFLKYFSKFHPNSNQILLFGENHTRNKFYLLNLKRLQDFLISIGKQVRVTIDAPDLPNGETVISLTDHESIHLIKFSKSENFIYDGDWKPDLIISNNDFSAGLPDLLKDISIPVIPSPNLGWQVRRKSRHFEILAEVIQNFCKKFSVDPWLFLPLHSVVEKITATDLSPLASAVDELIAKISLKYKEHNIHDQPYAFIKNDSGTYGLGVISVASGTELMNLNRKKREKLFSVKAGAANSNFLIQEGIPTHDAYSEMPIEPVIYGVGDISVGGFFRIHAEKSRFESLNSPGATFSCLCLHALNEPHETQFIDCAEKKSLVGAARFMARFASLAAALEL